MSGRAKRGIYYAVTVLCLFLALAAFVLMALSVYRERRETLYTLCSVLFFLAAYILVSPTVLVHECGHLLFGACAGLKPVSVSLGRLLIEDGKVRLTLSSVAGATAFIPKRSSGLKGRMMVATLGGATLNFIFGVVFSVLFFVLPAHPILLFFELFAPLHFYEGIAALLPAQLRTGNTDGEFIRNLKLNTPEAQVFLNVLVVQGKVYFESFDQVDEALLFDTPVVREDDEAFLSLLHLRWQYLMWKGEPSRAEGEIARLYDLGEYLDERTFAKVKCDLQFTRLVLGNKSDLTVPEGAEDTIEAMRLLLALGQGDIEAYKKRTAQASAAVKAFESTIFERFIQNF